MTAQRAIFFPPIKSIVDLIGPDTPGGAVAGGAPAAPTAVSITTLTGASTLAIRPSTAPPTPAEFLATFSGTITGGISLTLPIPAIPPVLGDYVPGDIVTVLSTPAVKAAQTIAVIDGGSGTPTLVTAPSATVNSQGAFVRAQLNAAGTHWVLLSFGGF